MPIAHEVFDHLLSDPFAKAALREIGERREVVEASFAGASVEFWNYHPNGKAPMTARPPLQRFWLRMAVPTANPGHQGVYDVGRVWLEFEVCLSNGTVDSVRPDDPLQLHDPYDSVAEDAYLQWVIEAWVDIHSDEPPTVGPPNL